MARRAHPLAMCLAIMLPVAAVRAQPAPPTPMTGPQQPAPPRTSQPVPRDRGDAMTAEDVKPESYRWQIAMLDAASVAVFAGSVALAYHDKQVDSVAGLGFAASALTYVLGGPVVHGVHDQGSRALASIGLRMGMPYAGALIGVVIASSHGPSGAFHDELPDGYYVGVLVGCGLGVAAAMLIDTALVAGEIRVRQRRDRWSPQVSVSADHVGLGIGARF